MVALARAIDQHSSLLWLAAGSGSLFLANLLLAHNLSKPDYGAFGWLMTLIAVQHVYGFLGFDQVILRVSNVRDGALAVPRNLLVLLLIAGAVLSVLLPVVVLTIDEAPPLNVPLVICTLILISALHLASTFARLQGHLGLAMGLTQGWKLFLLVGVLYGFASNIATSTLTVLVALAPFALLAIVHVIKMRVGIERSGTDFLKFLPGFALSLGVVTYLSYFDRWLVQEVGGLEEFGRYYYLQNLFLFPLLLLSTHMGFIQLTAFKRSFSSHILHSSLIRSIVYAMGVAVATLAFGFALGEFGVLSLSWASDLQLVSLLLLAGSLRVVYSVLSAAMGATSSAHSIVRANLWSVLGALVATASAFLLQLDTPGVVILLICAWLVRAAAYYLELTVNLRRTG